MRHFHRTSVVPADVMVAADEFFPRLGMLATVSATALRARTFSGVLGTVTLTVKPEGGHYTLIDAHTDQMGESRLDKNVKKFFVRIHRAADPTHPLLAGY